MFFFFLAVVLLVSAKATVDDFEREGDVIIITQDNMEKVLEAFDFVLVEFYAPWCGYCKKLAPEYDQAATTLKEAGSLVQLAKIDATVERELAKQFRVEAYPDIKFFRGGSLLPYEGRREAKDIVDWVTKESAPSSRLLTTKEEVEEFIAAPGVKAIAYSPYLLATWLRVGWANTPVPITRGHVVEPELLSGREDETIELYKEDGSVVVYEGEEEFQPILNWLILETFPVVSEVNEHTWSSAQYAHIDQLIVYFNEGDEEKARELALAVGSNEVNKHKVAVFVSGQIATAKTWGSSGTVSPTALFVDNNAEGTKPFVSVWREDGPEMTPETLQQFIDDSVAEVYQSFSKSQSIPSKNDGPVKVAVAKNWNEVVKVSKDVFVEFHAPWCNHCKYFTEKWDALGQHFANDEGVVIATLDITANALPKGVDVKETPTLILWDANNKRVEYTSGDRDLESLKKWIAEHRVTTVPASAETKQKEEVEKKEEKEDL